MSSFHLKATGRLVVCVTAVIASAALAQGVTGSALTGKVTGPDGRAALAGVTLKLTNTATGATFAAASNASGVYVLDNIPPGGPYQLDVTLEGYYPAKRADLQLNLGQRLTNSSNSRPWRRR
jgi:carboxypeptidase family protein